ncbi:YifB family Mg chelatase-like AAA ATPase [Janthinobacterium agaricidamnosum]|uniref:Magnesium chelatase, subunit ChlI family protein n=1 Tax=Janthinobacterium agaricidamnosum NBRC 102515 = DSM 9628 TaxID=1349767 RepID=W0V8Y4_9BURK|nr:YifB family Mg chelatase-like AAA ATPase [Janthinobacterium agaricidamnosum]CDG85289.1 magnesium chelatase, subunit ChlI family protein [Janthinobacterium agaricidamnosum NBRC 102515 = DSM 9628]
MSLAVLKSRALAGMDAPEVSVEVHLANGLPSFTIVGLPDTEVKESRDRVRAALQNCGFDMPARRITANLAPADLPKESGRFDLPIALGILAASGQIPGERFHEYEFAGELSLSGQLRPVRGALAMTFAMQGGDGDVARAFILPQANADEAALVKDANIFPASTLLQVCAHFAARDPQAMLQRHHSAIAVAVFDYPDFSDVKGQQQAKRALEVAAAGMHNVLMVGPPGAGKSMLAVRFPGLLPPMTDKEALESAAVQSLSGNFTVANWKRRPYRAPHHTCSGVALVGGGNLPRPGEISLAHCGILFLDEIAEFDRRVLEVLRQPLESGHITISRAARQADFPARFQLIAAMNPCPCGFLGAASAQCRCTPDAILRYHSRLSGPLLDRIDMQIEVAAMIPSSLSARAEGESTADIRHRVMRAFELQLARQNKSNQHLSTREIDRYCTLDIAGEQLLQTAMVRLHWSARAYHRVLKVARTIADLAAAPAIQRQHIAEAIQYRRALRER